METTYKKLAGLAMSINQPQASQKYLSIYSKLT